MNQLYLVVIIAFLAILIAVILYNMYQEKQYRRKIRSQFGHSDHDALLGSQTESVRDGMSFGGEKLQRFAAPKVVDSQIHSSEQEPEPEPESTDIQYSEPLVNLHFDEKTQEISMQTNVKETTPSVAVDTESTQPNTTPFSLIEDELHTKKQPALLDDEPQAELPFTETPVAPITPIITPTTRRLLIELDDLTQHSLTWFDTRFDYVAHVALYQPKELQTLPRLSGGHHFQIAGCTMDSRFQLAEPIPGVHYQAFAIGLQAISRKGLTTAEELRHFQQQVRLFADKMDGEVKFPPLNPFLANAKPLDELCARVDQTIAIHLVSRSSSVLGTELRLAVEQAGFVLQEDGVFTLTNTMGDVQYTISTLDGTAFTDALLSSQPYKGFSMLLDITRVPHGEEVFNQFIGVAVKLSSMLNLDLVDDQVRQLSTDWLKEVRSYIHARQDEMTRIGIEPGSALAKRLFT